MRFLLVLPLLALTAASAFAQTTSTVEGTVTSHESGAALEGVAVSLWRGDSDLAATSTDADGRYMLQVTITSAENLEQPAETFALGPVYPNPGQDRFNVGIETTKAGSYSFSVVDVLGRRLIHSSMELGAGRHQVQLSGLPAGGLYVLHVEGPAFGRSTAFSATGGGGFPAITLEQAGMPSLSLAATASSDYTLRFEKSGFYDESFPILAEDTTLDAQLEAVRYGTATYAVTVRNERFDHAVRNALVTIWDAEADSLLGHHFTDAEGNATVEYPHPLHRDGTSRLTSIEAVVERDGYEPWRETRDFEPSITREVDLPWIPQYVSATYDLELLNHMLKTPVKDATVRILDQTGANIYAQGQTNADGRITRTVSVEIGPNGQPLEDYLTLTAQRPGYENLESTLEIKPEETHQATIDLEKIPQRNSFNINAFDIHGDPVDDHTTFYFDVGKGQVYAFNPQNGLLAVMISDYADYPSEDVKVYHDHPEHLYNDITVFRARNAEWHEDPMNNNITHEWMPGQPFDT